MIAKKLACPCCSGDLFMPVSRKDSGVHSVYTFFLVCKQAVAPIVDRNRYDQLEFLPALSFSWAAAQKECTLS